MTKNVIFWITHLVKLRKKNVWRFRNISVVFLEYMNFTKVLSNKKKKRNNNAIQWRHYSL